MDGDYASTQGNPSRRNSEAPTRSEDERGQDGSEILRQAKANLSDDLAYVQAGSRRASKYDLYWGFIRHNTAPIYLDMDNCVYFLTYV